MSNGESKREKTFYKGRSLSDTKRVLKALRMRRAGMDYRQIVEAGVYSNEKSACRAVRRELRRIQQDVQDEAAEIHTIELERLDAMQRALWEDATNMKGGAHRNYAIDRMLALMQRRAKLLGLDEPQRMALGGDPDNEEPVNVYIPDNGRDSPPEESEQ